MFHHTTEGAESFAEATSYVPDHPEYRTGPDDYLDLLIKAKMSVNIPIIASLNGYSITVLDIDNNPVQSELIS